MANYRFLPPKRDDLSRQQKIAIDSQDKLILNGAPGTGKTTVALFRFINNHSNHKKTLLFTYGRVLNASLKGYVSEMDETNSARSNIYSFNSWISDQYQKDNYITSNQLEYFKCNDIVNKIDLRKIPVDIEEIIFDEAQDISIECHKVMQRLFPNKISIGADDCQRLQMNGATMGMMKQVFSNNVEKELSQNYRNTYQIYAFAIGFLPDNERVQNESVLQRLISEKNVPSSIPVLYRLSQDNNALRNKLIYELVRQNSTRNVGIIAHTPDTVDIISRSLTGSQIEHTKYHSGMKDDEKQQQLASLKNIIVTTNKSSKGLEFDVVIIPSLRNPKPNAGKDNYVSCTRAKTSLHILTNTEIPNLFNGQLFRNKFKIETY